MSNLKHTPGPWTASRRRDGFAVNACGAILFGESAEADARLIAAAPELLECLQQAIEHCPCSVRERQSGHRTECLAPLWTDIVEKATGEEK